ncbi:hypothetical protein ACFL0D_08670, partial [Thermoproteota archaeon]
MDSDTSEGRAPKEATPKKKGYSIILAFSLVLSLGLNGFLYLNYNSLNEQYFILDESYESVRVETHDSGFEEGNASGYLLGLVVGEEMGYDSGYQTGFEVGDQDGYLDGYREGYSQGNIMGIENGHQTGFKEGLEKGALGDFEGWGTFVRNPTYNEVLEFIGEDETDEVEYIESEFECLDFCMMFRNNAFKKGYISYTVWIDFEGQSF